jgi:hypothetical protein
MAKLINYISIFSILLFLCSCGALKGDNKTNMASRNKAIDNFSENKIENREEFA